MADDLASPPQGASTAAPPAAATPSPATPTPADATAIQAPAQDSAQPSQAVPPAQDSAQPSQAAPPAQDAAPPAPKTDAAPAAGDSLLAGEPAKTDTPPAEVPRTDKAPEAKDAPPVEPKKEEGAQSVEPAPLPSYEAFTLPEGVKADDVRLGEFTKMLGEFEVGTKADHAAVQKFGQDLVNRHIAEVQNAVKSVTDYYSNAFEKQKSDWKAELMKDPELGGNRLNTAAKEIADTIATTSSKEEHDAFRAYLSQSGIANNLAIGRPIYNLVKEVVRLRTKYESESGTKPLAGAKPATQPVSKLEKRYGKRN